MKFDFNEFSAHSNHSLKLFSILFAVKIENVTEEMYKKVVKL